MPRWANINTRPAGQTTSVPFQVETPVHVTLQPNSPTWTPGGSLVSATCQTPIGMPVTAVNAAAWNTANPSCTPVFATTDVNGNPIFQSSTSPLQAPAPTFLGLNQNTALIIGGVLTAAIVIGAVAFLTNQPE